MCSEQELIEKQLEMLPERHSYEQVHKAAECQCHQVAAAAEAPPVKHTAQLMGGQVFIRRPHLWSVYLLVLRDSTSKTQVYTAQVTFTV